MFTNIPGSCGSNRPWSGARHIFTTAAYQRLVEAEQEGSGENYYTETPVGMHANSDLYTGGTVAKRVATEGSPDDWRGADSLQPVSAEYEDQFELLNSDEVCPSCRDAWIRKTGLAERRDTAERLEVEP